MKIDINEPSDCMHCVLCGTPTLIEKPGGGICRDCAESFTRRVYYGMRRYDDKKRPRCRYCEYGVYLVWDIGQERWVHEPTKDMWGCKCMECGFQGATGKLKYDEQRGVIRVYCPRCGSDYLDLTAHIAEPYSA